MKPTELPQAWNEQKIKLIQKLDVLAGYEPRNENTTKKLRVKLGKTKEEMEQIINALHSSVF
jgi:hypothetical protein